MGKAELALELYKNMLRVKFCREKFRLDEKAPHFDLILDRLEDNIGEFFSVRGIMEMIDVDLCSEQIDIPFYCSDTEAGLPEELRSDED